MANLKIGIVGFGYWGKNQARVFDELGVLEGIYEKNLSLSKGYKKKYKFFQSYKQLLMSVDAVVICTPAKTHFKLAKEALEKVDVLVEKPIALNMKEVREIEKISKKNKKIVMVGHQLHFHPAVKKMKNLIENGTIGDLKYAYSNRLNLGKIRPNENVLWSFAPHDISLILDFIKSDIKKIDVQSNKVFNNKIEDTTLTLIKFSNNINAHIFVSWIHPFKEQRFTIVGNKGSLVFSDTEKNKLRLYNTEINKKTKSIDRHTSKVVKIGNKEPLKEQGIYFLQCLKKRKVEINDINHAYKVVSFLEKCSNKIKQENKND